MRNLIYKIKMVIYKFKCRVWQLTEIKKTIRFTASEQSAIMEISLACLRDLNLEAKSQVKIHKLLKKIQKKVTKLDYYECQDLGDIFDWAMEETSFNCSCLADKVFHTPFG